jgi:hypothetical protein
MVSVAISGTGMGDDAEIGILGMSGMIGGEGGIGMITIRIDTGAIEGGLIGIPKSEILVEGCA